jgi:D-alanyl-D-alanine carboxypeptidase
MPADPIAQYEERVRQTLRELGIPVPAMERRRKSFHLECEDLVPIGPDMAGREQRMERRAAAQWQLMREAAGRDGVVLAVVSAFRSFEYQRQIIARKLAAGHTVEQILSVSALPGFSEHHTGRAVDIGTPGCSPLTEAFEQTEAYVWLSGQGRDFGFRLTYPKGNLHGVVFEPWHWIFSETRCSTVTI